MDQCSYFPKQDKTVSSSISDANMANLSWQITPAEIKIRNKTKEVKKAGTDRPAFDANLAVNIKSYWLLAGADLLQTMTNITLCNKYCHGALCLCNRNAHYTREQSIGWGNEQTAPCTLQGESSVALDNYGGTTELFVANLLPGKLMPSIVWKVDTARQSTNIANIVTSLSQYQ